MPKEFQSILEGENVTALHIACVRGFHGMVKLLIDFKANSFL